MKNSGECEFNCLPMLCHGDFKVSQSFTVLAYVGECYNLLPTDPYQRYLGESFAQYTWDDFFMGKVGKAMMCQDPAEKEKLIKECFATHIPAFMKTLDSRL